MGNERSEVRGEQTKNEGPRTTNITIALSLIHYSITPLLHHPSPYSATVQVPASLRYQIPLIR